MRVDAEPAYVLHLRPYRDTSAIVDVLTQHHGCVSVVARGLRGGGKNRQSWRAALQVGNLLYLSWQGRGELKTLTDAQAHSRFELRGSALYCTFYVNEIIERLLHRHDPQPGIFQLYGRCLLALSTDANYELALRRFEGGLLRELGYGIDYVDVDGGGLRDDANYQFLPRQGFVLTDAPDGLHGGVLRRLADNDYSGQGLLVAKRLHRRVLADLLGDRPLNSRKLFAQFRR
ncbi:DNA repair protein RecO [Spongiibacter sp. KMU-166]|uniref:DNA repair protein RecO n=1 Tax=Spongiibacter thalassae TaxID=2721624 RepID=A0ABX1GEW3_9GAMM|nr:DNA repair protein RecO [Spongiibacter thalassae]NKI17093.1 DNA repair protein RecO [Spongiibacter thalassae]